MPPIMPARRASPISASVWACRSLSSSMHAACWAMRTQTPLNSIPWARIQSSTLCPTRRLWTKKAAPCAWGVTPVLSCRAREWRRLTVQRRSASGTATAMSSTMSTAPRCAKQASCWRAPGGGCGGAGQTVLCRRAVPSRVQKPSQPRPSAVPRLCGGRAALPGRGQINALTAAGALLL